MRKDYEGMISTPNAVLLVVRATNCQVFLIIDTALPDSVQEYMQRIASNRIVSARDQDPIWDISEPSYFALIIGNTILCQGLRSLVTEFSEI